MSSRSTSTRSAGKNANLFAAKSAKNDEFYTQWVDVEREVNAYLNFNPDIFRGKTVLLPCDDPDWSNYTKYFALHFTEFGLTRLISTSYAPNSKPDGIAYQPSLLERESPSFSESLTRTNGKLFEISQDDLNADGTIDINDLQWTYLDGDGDFRSDEVLELRNMADMVLTNPPFSLFREFLAWLIDGNLEFAVIGNLNAITYQDVFPLIMANRLWLGTTHPKEFRDGNPDAIAPMKSFGNVGWFTNLDHGRRHEPLTLMTTADNRRYSKHMSVREFGYVSYDNYDAIEVPFVDAIPSDHDGVMGVPISFLNKYNPDQFEILGATQRGCHELVPDIKRYDDYIEVRPDGTPTGSSGSKTNENANIAGNDGKKNYFINSEGHVVQSAYQRLFIRHRTS